MNLPPFVYSKKFWEGISYLLAGAALILNYFGKLPDAYTIGAGAILLGILAVLRFFGINPTLWKK